MNLNGRKIFLISHEAGAFKAIENADKYDVFYFYSTEEYLLHSLAQKTISYFMKKDDFELTQIEGPVPSIEEIIAAAGTISFFGTKRLVYVQGIVLSSMNDDDVKALCDTMHSLENSIVIITAVFNDDKAKLTKKAKLLSETADKLGLAADLLKPSAQDAKRFVLESAKALNTEISPTAATILVERVGTDYFTLKNEIEKLCAACEYKEITKDLIVNFSVQNIDADVFDMVRMITSHRIAQALSKLNNLIDKQNEPIAITAALAGSFIDVYRMKCADKKRINTAKVMKDFGYKGSDYRLKKASQTAREYKLNQLEKAIEILCELDIKLKSSPVNSVVLLQSAICEIATIGA